MNAHDQQELKRLLELATKDHFLGDFVMKKKLEDAILLHDDGKTVGFAIPRKEKDGYWRTGPIYVQPESRSKGIARHFIETFFEHKPGRCWIDPKNLPSIKAFTSAGFRKSGKKMYDSGELLEEYLFTPSASSEQNEVVLDPVKERLLHLAMNDPYLGPMALKSPEKMHVIELAPTYPVGFIMPSQDADGRHRTGSIYIEEEYRGKGIAGRFVKDYFKDKPGRAWILPSNRPSIATYKGAGFYRTGKQATVNNKTFDEYINRHHVMNW